MLNSPEGNILIDIHTVEIGEDDEKTQADDYFSTIPRNCYVILITDIGKTKCGTSSDAKSDIKMYANPAWSKVASREIIDTAQLYLPGDVIFNPYMKFDEKYMNKFPGTFNIFMMDGSVHPTINYEKLKSERGKNPRFERKELIVMIGLESRHNIRVKPMLQIIPTCDPWGKQPNNMEDEQWNELLRRRGKLQINAQRKFLDLYHGSRMNTRSHNYNDECERFSGNTHFRYDLESSSEDEEEEEEYEDMEEEDMEEEDEENNEEKEEEAQLLPTPCQPPPRQPRCGWWPWGGKKQIRKTKKKKRKKKKRRKTKKRKKKKRKTRKNKRKTRKKK
jgi:hypothetical protein